MILKKIIPAILYLCVAPSALSGETSDLVTGTITVKDSFVDSRIMKFPATVETYDKKQIEESVNAATPAQTLKYLPSIQVRERSIGDRNGIISSRTIEAYLAHKACSMQMASFYLIYLGIHFHILQDGAW